MLSGKLLPLAHAVDLIRPVMLARPIESAVLPITVFAVYAVSGFVMSAILFQRGMMK